MVLSVAHIPYSCNCSLICVKCYIHRVDCRTPLHWAAATGHAPCVAHLLRLESHKDAEDKHGGTPFQYAQQGHHSACCQLLIDHDPNNPLATEIPVRRGNTCFVNN